MTNITLENNFYKLNNSSYFIRPYLCEVPAFCSNNLK